MTNYFNNVETLEELRSQYKKLLKKYHPDNKEGSEEITKRINTEYESLFKVLKNRHDSKQTERTSKSESNYNSNMYDWENDKALREVLQKIINFEGIEIEIAGQWIWCFNSYTYRKELKELGFKFGNTKKAWYFHTEAFRKSSKKTLSMNEIRNYYGSTKIQAADSKKLLEA
ncbi:MAG: J domain-containing protein [Hespellia sp.]|nr:J domain-containing protein [Hespellia sp.]